MTTHPRTLTLDELEAFDAFTVVWDKFGDKFFKLGDQHWSSLELTTMSSEELAKHRVRLYTLT